jgi:hypothetical protein
MTMIKPKSHGGLGFKDLRLFNQAMRFITYPHNLCAQVLKARYFPQGNPLDMAPAGEASPTWRSIEYVFELLKHGVIKRIGDGEGTRIWRDNWLPRPPSLKPAAPTRSCRLRRVSHLIQHDTNDWDEGIIRRYFHSWDAEEILKIRLPLNKSPDFVARHYEKSGIFSVRSAYRLAMSISHNTQEIGSSTAPSGDRVVWRRLWKLPTLPKVRVFLWKLINNGLPTNANRCYHHIVDDGACEMCRHWQEDCFHAVVDCPHARALRLAMRERWCLPPEEKLRNVGPEWFLVLLDLYKPNVMASLDLVLWRAWSVRNKVTRAGERLSIDDSVAFLLFN